MGDRDARRSHVTLHDGGKESRFSSPVRQGGGAQQQRDLGPGPRRIVTTHRQQEPGRQAPQRLPPRLTRPSTNPEPTAFPPPAHRPQEGHSPMADGALASGPPKHQPDRYTCHQAGRWGWLWYPRVQAQGPSRGARPGPSACCSAISSSAESDHVARPRQEQQ